MGSAVSPYRLQAQSLPAYLGEFLPGFLSDGFQIHSGLLPSHGCSRTSVRPRRENDSPPLDNHTVTNWGSPRLSPFRRDFSARTRLAPRDVRGMAPVRPRYSPGTSSVPPQFRADPAVHCSQGMFQPPSPLSGATVRSPECLTVTTSPMSELRKKAARRAVRVAALPVTQPDAAVADVGLAESALGRPVVAVQEGAAVGQAHRVRHVRDVVLACRSRPYGRSSGSLGISR